MVRLGILAVLVAACAPRPEDVAEATAAEAAHGAVPGSPAALAEAAHGAEPAALAETVHGAEPAALATSAAEAGSGAGAAGCFEHWRYVPEGLEGRTPIGSAELTLAEVDDFLLADPAVVQSTLADLAGVELAAVAPAGEAPGHGAPVGRHWLWKWVDGRPGVDGRPTDHPNTYLLLAESDLAHLAAPVYRRVARASREPPEALRRRRVYRAKVLSLLEPGGRADVRGAPEAQWAVSCLVDAVDAGRRGAARWERAARRR